MAQSTGCVFSRSCLPSHRSRPAKASPSGAPRAAPTRPPAGTPMPGYYSTRLSTSVHDDLHAKAIVMEAGGQRVALVACDLVGIPPTVIEEAREIVQRE